MSDNNTPEEPKPNNEPAQGKGAFGWYQPPEGAQKPLAEPDPDFSHNNPDIAPLTDQETLFRAAAIKCAEMEEELNSLMEQTHEQEFKAKNEDAQIRFVKAYYPRRQLSSLTSWKENIGRSNQRSVVQFNNGYTGSISYDGEKLGINTKMELLVGLHTDEPTRKEFEEFEKIYPEGARYDASTIYFFNTQGEFRKLSLIPRGMSVDPSRIPLYSRSYSGSKKYESEMTPGDFELAGQALQMLINRLKPQEQQEVDPGSSSPR